MPTSEPPPAIPTPARAQTNRLYGELIAQARAGGLEAFERLYDATARWLLGQVRRIVGDGQAEDVLADTYLQIWKSLGSYDASRASPMVWLAMMARSRALDHLRREKVRVAGTVDPDDPDTQPAGIATPEDLASCAQQERLLCGLLAGSDLTAQERLVVGLAYFRDSTQQEIACATGLSLRQVRTALARAHDKLRAQLQAAALQPARASLQRPEA